MVILLTMLCFSCKKRLATDSQVKSSELETAAPHPQTLSLIEKRWGKRHEGYLTKVVKFLPRLTLRPIKYLITGKTVYRTINTATGTVYLAKSASSFAQNEHYQSLENLEIAGYKYSDSILNPLALANDMVSDAVMTIKSPLYAFSKVSNRVHLCTNNLASSLSWSMTFFHPITPAHHVAVLIDGGVHETKDALAGRELWGSMLKGGIMCSPIPLLDNQSDSVAIERLMCADSNYNSSYDFFGNNCAGYTRDVLSIAAAGYPGMPNLGVGAEIRVTDNDDKIERTKEGCDARMENIRQVIYNLEKGVSLDQQLSLFVRRSFSSDVVLQFYVSAARGKNAYNRNLIAGIYGFNPSIYGQFKIKAGMLRFVHETFVHMDPEAYEWLQKVKPEIAELYQLVAKRANIDPLADQYDDYDISAQIQYQVQDQIEYSVQPQHQRER